MVMFAGVTYSNCTVSPVLLNLYSGRFGVAGSWRIAPIGSRSGKFRVTRLFSSATYFSKTMSLIPPPRFVRWSSMSEFRNVSVFSTNATGAGRGEACGRAGALEGMGELVAVVSLGAGDGVEIAPAGAGRDRRCFAM